MLTSVVIPCVDRADDTRACLRSLRDQDHDGEVEVVLVDNGSKDAAALAAAAQEFPRVQRLRLERNLGFAGGTNHGLAAARGEVLVVLNNDTMAAPSMLARMHRALAVTPQPAMVGPVSNYVKGSALLPVGDRGSTLAGRRSLDADLGEQCGGMVQDVDALAGLCLMFRRAVLDQVGGFDARFGLGNFEDDDFALRARLAGGRLVIARDAFLHHWGSRTFRTLGVDYQEQMAVNQAVFAAKWAHEPAWAALVAAQAGDAERAGQLAVEAMRVHPQWPEGHLFAAQWARARGDHDAARQHAERFLRQCPASWPGHVVHTLSLGDAGRLSEAARAAQEALRCCFVDADVAADLLAYLASACAGRGEHAAAQQAQSAAIELSPRGERHHRLGALLAAAGDLRGAGAAFAKAVALGHLGAAVDLGGCQWQLGERGAALQTLARALARSPSDARARAALGTVLDACAGAGLDVRAARAALALAPG